MLGWWGGKFCLFFHNMGIGYQYLEKIGKKVLYLVLLSFVEFLPDLTEMSH